ncbi:MAG: NAD(P)H-dependent glycerol-3-phosphate dehydrogenase [Elusimicrobiota bacterium]
MKKEKIAVLGGGSWGATLAAHLGNLGHDVMIWEFVKEVADYLEKNRHLKTLPHLKLPSSIKVSNDLSFVLKDRPIILCVVPSPAVRSTFEACQKTGMVNPGTIIINASKGIENQTFLTMTQVVSSVLKNAGDLVAFSGPSHAEEIALGKPAVLVAASKSNEAAERTKNMFLSENFRVYTSQDPLGVQLGGAIKNVFAVACGVIDGLKLGDNTKAALMTRGLIEMARIGKSFGAETLTFFGLSGLGDLIVTCASQHSRNRLLGDKIGSGKSVETALSEMTMVAEGYYTAKSAFMLAKKNNIDAPIIEETYKILYEKTSPQDSMKRLMSRQVGAEMEGLVL